jgi:hypothetical protein
VSVILGPFPSSISVSDFEYILSVLSSTQPHLSSNQISFARPQPRALSSTSDGSIDNFKTNPFIFTIVTVTAFLVSLGWGIYVNTMRGCVLVSISIGGVVETVSWCIVLGFEAHILSEDIEDSNVAVVAILGAAVMLMVSMNVIFTLAYQIWIIPKDKEHASWLKEHKGTGVFVNMMLLVSFKYIRMIYSKLFNLKQCSAKFALQNKLYKMLITLSILSFIFITLPIVGVYIYLLCTHETYSTLWIIILDSLITTSLVFFLGVLDVFQMLLEVTLSLHVPVEIKTKSAADHDRIKNSFPIDETDTKRSTTFFNKTYFSDVSSISNNVPIVDNLEEEVSPIKNDQNEDTMKPGSSSRTLSKQLLRRNTIYSEDVLYSLLKSKVHSETELELTHAEVDEYDQECIKVFHLTYGLNVLVRKSFDGAVILEDSRSNGYANKLVNPRSYSLICVDSIDVHIGRIQIKSTGDVVRVKRYLGGCEVVDLKQGDRWIIGRTVVDEEDFDMMRAEVDDDDNEAIIVTHFKTNFRVKIKQTFNSAARVDLITGKTLESEKGVCNYDPSMIQVDRKDVSYGYIREDGNRIKLKRSFTGAPILDLYYPKLLSELKTSRPKPKKTLHAIVPSVPEAMPYSFSEDIKTTKDSNIPQISFLEPPKERRNNISEAKLDSKLIGRHDKLERMEPSSSQVLILRNQGIRMPVPGELRQKKGGLPSLVPFPKFTSPSKEIPDFSVGPLKEFGS